MQYYVHLTAEMDRITIHESVININCYFCTGIHIYCLGYSTIVTLCTSLF